jgi:hypothetical protein
VLADDQAPLAAIRAACAEDVQKLCAGVQPGGGRSAACLKEYQDSLSERCKQAAAPGGSASKYFGTQMLPVYRPLPEPPMIPIPPQKRRVYGNPDSDDGCTVSALRQGPGGFTNLISPILNRPGEFEDGSSK